jgi:hypothetical protein
MDNLLTNKYFCIAVLIALGVLLYLYSQKDSCSMEPMQNLNLTPLSQELSQHPWTDSLDGSTHASADTKFDEYADAHTKQKLKNNNYHVANFLPRSDVAFMNYAMSDSDISDNLLSSSSPMPIRKRKSKKTNKLSRSAPSVPQPIDTRPDLSQCQPCPPCPVCNSNVSGNKIRH